MVGSDDCNAILRVTGSNGTHYLLVGSVKGLIVTTPDALVGSIVSTRRLNNIDIRAIASVGGIAWLATAQGLYSFDPVNNVSQRYGAASGAPSDALTSVTTGSQGVVWVGSSNGIGRFVPSSHTWTVWRAGDVPAPGLAANDVRDLIVARTKIGSDTHDIVWIATSAGVSRLDPALPSFTTFTQEDGLPSNSVRTIALIRDDTKVFATDSGAVAYDGI
jgi:ligand-binding sensor domain-containing protein